ncbi:MAG: NAD(P)-binding protein [Pseudomonadota bacterium]
MRDPRYDILFESVKIGPVTAPNRFYAVPHATGHGWSQPHGSTALRAMKAEGGWGVVAMQMTEIAPDSDMASHPMDRIWDDCDVAMHAAQADAIHEHGALAAIELAHGGMRARNFTTGTPPVGPSAGRILRPEAPIQARAMDKSDIRAFRAAHRAAAGRAISAGYDIIYVYAAHDLSLLSHFLSPRTNQRGDEYGGSLDNRMRLLREVLEDTLEEAAGARAVALRFSVAEPDHPAGLRHSAEGREVVEALAELPDIWDVNLSGWPADSQTSRFSEEGFQLPFTDFVKAVTTKPVVGVGRFTSPDAMVAAIRKGRLDMIGGARPSIADPFLPAKIRDGRVDEIRECIGCNVCVSMDGYGVPVRCTQNATIGEEWRRGWHPEVITGARPKSHLIIGAGAAGLECAATLLRAGHKVTLADARDEPGGRVTREARLPGLSAWGRVRDHRLALIEPNADADLYLSSRLSANEALEFGADTIAIATGATWRADGVGAMNRGPADFGELEVWTPDDVMDGAAEAPASRVIVYDDDHYYMGSLMVEALRRVGHEVSYVTPMSSVSAWTDFTLEQGRIIDRLNALGVPIHVNTSHARGARFRNLIDGAELELEAERIVTVGARVSDDQLYHDIKSLAPEASLHLIGDAYCPGLIQAAVFAGHAKARDLIGDNAPARRERPQLEDAVA